MIVVVALVVVVVVVVAASIAAADALVVGRQIFAKAKNAARFIQWSARRQVCFMNIGCFQASGKGTLSWRTARRHCKIEIMEKVVFRLCVGSSIWEIFLDDE